MNAKNLVLLVVVIFFSSVIHAQRFALVIGNSDYDKDIGQLSNPVNDARDMSALLKTKEFNVTTLINANRLQMKRGIAAFTKQLYQKDAVGLFFYAGHGVEVGGRNYLIPIGATIEGEGDVEFESVDAGRVMGGMEYAGNNLNLVILDACRNNPFARGFRSANNGLARMDPPKGSLILYATSPGDVASDGNGRNGLFTQYLLEAIDTPNLTVEKVFKTTANNVYRATNKKQLPWQSGVMLGDFYFTLNAPNAEKIIISQPADHSKQAEVVFWDGIKNETEADYFRSYLAKYPKGIYAQLAKIKIQSDEKILTESLSQKSKQLTARLTIKTSPDNANIRILNIAPKYQQGMSLKSGRYHIEVSHVGYQRHTEWIVLDKEDMIHSVVLEENQAVISPINSIQSSPTIVTTIPPKKIDFGIALVSITAACFQMGSEHGSSDEEPAHKVCLSAYDMGKYEVTQTQWKKIMGNNPSFFRGSNRPVEEVSWNEVQDYIRQLNKQTGQHYRLPTEAEWEYACRSGGKAQNFCGGNSVRNVGWYDENAGDITHNIGLKQANSFGLYDMSGNVWEWVQDRYDSDYYTNSPTDNPKGAATTSNRVNRGGSWSSYASNLGSTNRNNNSPDYKSYYLGFRLAKTP